MTEKRIDSIRKILDKNSAALITSEVNRYYLSGFSSSAGTVIITPKRSALLIDFRYFEKAKATVKDLDVILTTEYFKDIKNILGETENLFIENEGVTLKSFEALKNNLSVNIVNDNTLSSTLNKLRQIKSEGEISLIKQAQSITDSAFSHILSFIKSGVNEREIALELEFFMRKNGSDGVAFDTIAVSGKNSSLPHGVPTDKPLEKGDFLTMDFGAKFGGYCSDMTRTVAIGEISKEQGLVYETVLTAQKECLSNMGENKKCCDIDRIARNIIDNAGFKGTFGHGLGHSVGLEIHESPACNTRDDALLKEGMLMTVEPGIYLENKFGVRIEDMVLVTKTGIENLTKSPKELIII